MTQTIQQYAVARAESTAVALTEIPKARPYARKHVDALQAEGRSGAVIRQLVREGQSSRRVSTEAGLLENATALNVDVLQAGLDSFLVALQSGKRTKRGVSRIEHTGGKSNPINELTVETQANATWDTIVAAAGRMADVSRPLSVQTLAGMLAGRLCNLCCGADVKQDLAYEKAALLLLDHFAASTGWLEEKTGEVKMMSRTRKPNTFALTRKFLDEVLGGGLAADFSERRPMLVPPVPWTVTATHGGYLHSEIPAVRGTSRAIGSVAIVSAINALQGTAFRVNTRILALAESMQHNAESLQGKLVAGKYLEARHDESEDVQQAKTIRSALTISAMRELRDAEEFYFPWNLDWRGRMYPATSIISPQGADLCKGCLEFADGTPLGREGGKWLAVHLCNLAGADKEIVGGEYRTRTPEEREAWTRWMTPEILEIAADPLANRAWHLVGGFGLRKLKRGKEVPVALDKPWQFLAACFEWAEYLEQGDGFRSRLAGALDGSCSGVQMLAGMTRDRSAGTMVNLVPAPRGDDYYGRMATALSKRIYDLWDVADDKDRGHLMYWSEQTIDRDLLKAPSMTKVYSAGTYTFGEQVRDKTQAPETEAMWLAAQINACFGDVAPGMLRAMSYLQEVADVLTATGLPLVWVTPAGLEVEQASRERYGVRVQTPAVIEGQPRPDRMFYFNGDTLSKKGQRSGVAPNFVHGVDAAHMVMTVNALYAQGVRNFWMVHDSFGAPFAQCQEVFDTTREQFVALMSPDLLRIWTEQVTAGLTPEQREKLPELPEYGDLDVSQVRESVYAWY